MKIQAIIISQQTKQDIRSLFWYIKEPSRAIDYRMFYNVKKDLYPIFGILNKTGFDEFVKIDIDKEQFFYLVTFLDLIRDENRRADSAYRELVNIWNTEKL
jgi:hypothetical protein